MRLGLGTAQFGFNYGFSKVKTQSEVNKILSICVKHGINFLDTARDYGNSESKIGFFIKRNKARNNFFIATKLSKIDSITAKNKENLKRTIIRSIKDSCKELNVESIDLLQLHQEESFLLSNDNFWNIILALKKNNKIKKFGLSIYEVSTLKKIIQKKRSYIDFVQVPYNVFDIRFKKIFDYIRTNNIEIIGRSIFLKGIIATNNKNVPKELKNLLPYKKKLHEIARKYAFSVPELCLLFAMSNNNISTTIIGVNSLKELKENIKTINKLERFEEKALEELKKLKLKNNFLIDPRQWKNF